MPHPIAQAQGAIRAARAAFGFDSSRPGAISSVVVPLPADEPSSDATPAADAGSSTAVDGAPSSGSVSPLEDAPTEELSSPIATPSSGAGSPSSPTSVPAPANGVSAEPQAAQAVDKHASALAVPVLGVPVLGATSGQAAPVEHSPALSVAGLATELASAGRTLATSYLLLDWYLLPGRPSTSAYALEGVIQDAADSAVRRQEAYNERYFTNLAHPMVGLVRCPLLRVDPDLDRRLDGAHDLDTIVHAVAPGANTPPASWDTEMEILRGDVRYHRDQLRECEKWLYKETDIRRQAESLCALVSTERNEAIEEARALIEELDEVSRQAALAAVSLQKSGNIIDLLKARIGNYDKKIEEARFQALLDQVRTIQLHPTETSAGSKRPASSPAAAVHVDHESDSSSGESSEGSDVVLIEPPTKRRKGSSTSPKSKKKRSSSHSASRARSHSRRKSRLGKPSVHLRTKPGPSVVTQDADSGPSPGRAGVASEVTAGSPDLGGDQLMPVAPPPSVLPSVTVSSPGGTPLPPSRRSDASAAPPSSRGLQLATPNAATSARTSPIEGAVVIPPRRDGRPVRPASTVASLQSKSAVERENASDVVVLGSVPSGSSSTVHSVAGQDAGDGFVYGSPSMTFENMVIGPKARPARQTKAAKTKSTKVSKVAKSPKTAKPSRVVKHSVPNRKPSPSPASRALRPEGSASSRGKQSSTKAPKKHSNSASKVLYPPLTAPGVKECWTLIMDIRVPKTIPVSVMVQCSVDGIKAFGDWTNPGHPYQRLLASFPDEPCLFDASEYMPDKTISIRAAGVAIVVKLWRQFRGKAFGPTEKDDLGFALYDRGHWVATAAVERWLQQLAAILGDTAELYLAILAAWTERGLVFARSIARAVDPDVLVGTVAVGSDWVAEVLSVDGHEPWRNCWVDVPATHPYNTSFAPCNPKAPLFFPTGFNFQQIASAVQVDPSLDPCDVTTQWVQDYTEYHGPRPVVEEEEEGDGTLPDGGMSAVSAASGSSKAAGSSPSRAPPAQSDGDDDEAEEAGDSADSDAEDEELPSESPSKPPTTAIRLDVLANVPSSSK
ncbi:hypothetical protein PR001_g21409 [Phytophthora rubi]|uniref:Uncharacterized protein n=1 Tax=Phytophthora rubi TaxID=129364 RepID=A0A6A3JGP0_9STRA|nr:hypothetical protein PR001_g21409 [Phytophthora rubi]